MVYTQLNLFAYLSLFSLFWLFHSDLLSLTHTQIHMLHFWLNRAQLLGWVTVNTEWVHTRTAHYRTRFGWWSDFEINGRKWARFVDFICSSQCSTITQRKTGKHKSASIGRDVWMYIIWSNAHVFIHLPRDKWLFFSANGTSRVYLRIYNDGKASLPKFIAD